MSFIIGDLKILLSGDPGNTQELVGALDDVQKSGSAAEAEINSLATALAGYKAKLAEANEETRQTKADIAAMRPPIQGAKEDTDAFIARLEAWKAAQASLREELSRATAVQDQYRTVIKDTQNQLNQTISSVNTARAAQEKANAAMRDSVDASGAAGGGFKDLGQSVDKTVNSIQNIATRLIIRTALMDLATALKETAGAFQEAEAQITASTGIIGDNLKQFDDGLAAVADASGQTALDVGKAMGAVASAFKLGPGQELQTLTTDMLDLAKITGESAVKIADDTAKLVHAFNIPPPQIEGVLNRLLAVSQDAHIKFSDLEGDLDKFQGLFIALKVPVENAAQAIGKINLAGLPVSATLSAMQNAMDKLAKAGVPDLADALRQLFLRIHDASTEAEGFDVAAKFFGSSAGNMTAAIREGKLSFEEFYGAVTPIGATLVEQAASMRTLKDAWQEMKNQLADHEIGALITEEATAIVTNLTAIVGIANSTADVLTHFGPAMTSFAEAFLQPVAGMETLLGLFGKIKTEFDDFKRDHPYAAAIGTSLTNPLGGPQAFIDAYEANNANKAGGPASPAGVQFPFATGTAAFGSAVNAFPFMTGSGAAYSAASTSQQATNKGILDDLLAPKGGAGGSKYETNPQFLQLRNAIKVKEESMAGKNNLDSLWAQFNVLENMDSAAISLAQDLSAVNAEIAKMKAYGLAVPDSTYQKQVDLHNQTATQGMDTRSAEKILGLPDPYQVNSDLDLIGKAFAQLEASGTQSAGFLAIAWENALDRMISKARSVGKEVSSDLIVLDDWAHTGEKIQNMDFGLARQTLGLTTESQALQQTLVDWSAYQSVVQAANDGNATGRDVTNALADALTKSAAAAKTAGVAFGDGEQSMLDFLNTQKQINALNNESALALFGIKSEGALNNAVSLLEGAYEKLKLARVSFAIGGENGAPVVTGFAPSSDAAAAAGLMAAGLQNSMTAVQDVTAQYTILQDKINDLGKTGGTVTAAMVTQLENLKASALSLTTNLASSLQNLAVLTTNSANKSIGEIKQELDTVGIQYGKASAEYTNAAIKAYGDITSLLQKSGQAVPIAITQMYDSLKAKALDTTMTIDQAYSVLGVKSTQAVMAQVQATAAALKLLASDESVTVTQMWIANVNAGHDYYQAMIQGGQEFSNKNKALNDVMLAQTKDYLSNSQNMYSQWMNAVSDIWHSLSNDFASGITGLINGTQSVSQAFLKMGQDVEAIIVKYILNTLIFTQSNLHSLQSSLLGFLGAKPTGGGGGVAGDTGSPVGLGQAFGFLNGGGGGGGGVGGLVNNGTGDMAGTFAGDGTTSALSDLMGGGSSAGGGGIMGALGGLSGIVGIAGLGVSIVSGIVSGVQQAHANNLLDEIEKSVRKTWVATGEAGDSISVTSKTTSQKTGSMLDFMNGTLTQYLQNLNIDLDTIAGKNAGNFLVSIDVTPISSAIQGTNEILQNISGLLSTISDTESQILLAIGPSDAAPGSSKKSSRTKSTSITGTGVPIVEPVGIPTIGPTGTRTYPQVPTSGTVGSTYDPNYHLPGNDPGVPIGTNAGLAATGANSAALNSIWASLNTPFTENPHIADFLSGQTFNDFLSGITDVFGGLGINASSINTMFGSHLSQADFETLIAPELRRDLSNLLNAAGTPAGNDAHTQYSAEQISAINQGELVDLKDYFTNVLPSQISAIQGSQPGDIISTPRYGSEAQQLAIQQALFAQKPNLGETPALGAGGGPAGSNAFSDGPVAVVKAATGLAGALSSAGSFVVTSFNDFQKQLDQARRSALAGAGTSYEGGIAALQAADPYAAAHAGIASTTTVGTSLDRNSLLDLGNPNAYTHGNLINPSMGNYNIAINNAQFPTNATPDQVANGLMDLIRTKTALLR